MTMHMNMLHHLQRILTLIEDVCFPPSDELRIIRALTELDATALYAPRQKGGVTSLTQFSHPSVRALIHEAKYHASTHAQTLLGHILLQYLKEHGAPEDALWIPIPLSPSRFRSRGYNQVEKVLRALPRDIQPEIRTEILMRTRDTRPQVELPRTERLTNMRGAFTTLRGETVYDRHIVILDDVFTTGATLSAAEAALRVHNPKSITLLALAH
jgi:ComF family protein